MNSTNTAPIWKNVTSDEDKRSMRLFPNDGVTWAEMDAWLEKSYGKNGKNKHWDWRGFGEVGKPGFQVVLIHTACGDNDCESHTEEEDEDEWSETCECGTLCGGKVFHNEEEFDEHPDRDPGYTEDGEWRCEKCRTK